MKVLILSYHFPPHAIVGARRWAKFAKHLARKGHAVTVIAAQAAKDAVSPWDEDLLPTIRIHRLPPRYPRVLDESPATPLGKLRYKLSLLFVRAFSRGSPYDRSAFWANRLESKVKESFSAEGPADVVLANGPPFRLLADAVALKKNRPDLKVVVDVRDPWTWWFNMGYAGLSPRRRAYEENLEASVVRGADRILTPSEEIRSVLTRKYPGESAKVGVLPHGYDPEALSPRSAERPGIPRLIYYGSIYPGAKALLEEFVGALRGSGRPLRFDLYAFAEKFPGTLASSGSLRITMHPPLPERRLFEEVAASDFAVLFSFRGIEDFLATKYYEIVASRTPIVLVGEPGAASRFVEMNGLGVFLRSGSMARDLEKLFRPFVPAPFDASPYAFDRLTDDLLELIPKR